MSYQFGIFECLVIIGTALRLPSQFKILFNQIISGSHRAIIHAQTTMMIEQ